MDYPDFNKSSVVWSETFVSFFGACFACLPGCGGWARTCGCKQHFLSTDLFFVGSLKINQVDSSEAENPDGIFKLVSFLVTCSESLVTF